MAHTTRNHTEGIYVSGIDVKEHDTALQMQYECVMRLTIVREGGQSAGGAGEVAHGVVLQAIASDIQQGGGDIAQGRGGRPSEPVVGQGDGAECGAAAYSVGDSTRQRVRLHVQQIEVGEGRAEEGGQGAGEGVAAEDELRERREAAHAAGDAAGHAVVVDAEVQQTPQRTDGIRNKACDEVIGGEELLQRRHERDARGQRAGHAVLVDGEVRQQREFAV